MTVQQHPHAELSAYIDDALAPAARAAVDGHLVACAVCRGHVAELRATTVFVQALPDPVPSRRLVPRLGVPAWLAPVRTVMTLASGAAVFLFIASSLASNITFLAGGSPTGMTAREASGDAGANAQAPAATGAQLQDSTASRVPVPATSPEPARALGPTASPPVDTAVRGAQGPTTTDDAKRLEQQTAGPAAPGVGFSTESQRRVSSQPERSPFVNPWLWLTVAILSGAVAIALHRRLRASV